MCGRYSNDLPRETVRAWFRVDGAVPDLPPRWNVAPTQHIPVVRLGADGRREVALVRWGLVPHWSPGPRDQKGEMINARAETVASKPAFRDAFLRRRCVVLASAFYEWRPTAGGKQPYAIRHRDGAPMAFAGLWGRWHPRDGGDVLESATIVVGEANAAVAPIHDRQPVILLAPEEVDRWLDPATSPDALTAMLRPCPAEALVVYPVSRRVNSPTNDDAGLVEPLPS